MGSVCLGCKLRNPGAYAERKALAYVVALDLDSPNKVSEIPLDRFGSNDLARLRGYNLGGDSFLLWGVCIRNLSLRGIKQYDCTVEGCDSAVHYARGWCRKHYIRWYRHGDPLAYKGNKLPRGEAALNVVIRSYKRWARNRNFAWNLTREQARSILAMPCFYCGKEPSQVAKHPDYNGSFTYNGIDRVNNNEGYSEANCVPCCFTCNDMKRARTVNEFLDAVAMIHEHNRKRT